MVLIDTVKIEQILESTRKAVAIGHFNPDGDSVGSVTALYYYLSSRGMDVDIVLPSPPPAYLEFLLPRRHTFDAVTSPEQSAVLADGADTIFCLDFNTLSRAESLAPVIRDSQARKVLIDHHINPDIACFDAVVSMTDISSCCEILFWTLYRFKDVQENVDKLPELCARSLYAGMMTDTNNFSNSVYPSTFEMASMLIARGVDKDDLQERILHCYTVSRMRLMGHLLKSRLKYIPSHRAAYMLLSNREKDRYSFKQGDSEGFVNLPLSAEKVRISALFTENPDGKYIRVSLRSKGDVDVNTFANQYFNGGGHKNASGGRLYMPLEDVPQYFRESLKKFFGAHLLF